MKKIYLKFFQYFWLFEILITFNFISKETKAILENNRNKNVNFLNGKIKGNNKNIEQNIYPRILLDKLKHLKLIPEKTNHRNDLRSVIFGTFSAALGLYCGHVCTGYNMKKSNETNFKIFITSFVELLAMEKRDKKWHQKLQDIFQRLNLCDEGLKYTIFSKTENLYLQERDESLKQAEAQILESQSLIDRQNQRIIELEQLQIENLNSKNGTENLTNLQSESEYQKNLIQNFEKEKSNNENKISEFSNQIQTLKEENEKLKKEEQKTKKNYIKKFRNFISLLKKTISCPDDPSTNMFVKLRYCKIRDLMQELNLIELFEKSTFEIIEDFRIKISDSQKEDEKLIEASAKAEIQISKLQSKLDQQNQQIEELERFRIENLNLQSELENKKNLIQSIEKEKSKLSNQIQTLKEENKKLKKEIENIENNFIFFAEAFYSSIEVIRPCEQDKAFCLRMRGGEDEWLKGIAEKEKKNHDQIRQALGQEGFKKCGGVFEDFAFRIIQKFKKEVSDSQKKDERLRLARMNLEEIKINLNCQLERKNELLKENSDLKEQNSDLQNKYETLQKEISKLQKDLENTNVKSEL
ncbi:MAG: hypothetical protein LBJ32_01300 [Oscillospiraceae bacterium]|jgi:chromosome segregation ATPase|nr:hypothetical protein [Oscillospiraceae bacterium]